jgi:hypothetical protein
MDYQYKYNPLGAQFWFVRLVFERKSDRIKIKSTADPRPGRNPSSKKSDGRR